MKTLTRQELIDILYGCTVLGTGGGGGLQEGIALIDQALEAGKEFRLVSFDELDDKALVGTPYMCGSISPETEEERQKYAGLPRLEHHSVINAVKAMEDYLKRDFDALVSTELGGGNTAIAFFAAAMTGKCILDADPAGRSVPELQHSTYFINDLPIYPLSVANMFGDVAVFSEVVDDFRAEALVRALAVVSKNEVSVLDHPCEVGRLKNAMIGGAISYALSIGEALRQSREFGGDPAEDVAAAGSGVVRFRGTVSDFSYKTEDGFTFGDVQMKGTGEYEGRSYKCWFKNEHIFSWLDGGIDVTVPDLICILNGETGEPVTNPYFEKNMPLAVLALPAPKEWQSERGLACFGPASFGKDYEYRPIAERIK